jgi:hypothetical protein
MGDVRAEFHWSFIGPNESVGLFIHGYGKNDFVAFSITVNQNSNEPSGAYTQIAAQLTEGLTYDFDGEAHLLTVQNQTIGPQPYISVDLRSFVQSL